MIVAIEDTVADDLATNITLHSHEATALRWWKDAATQPGWLREHLSDHQLVQLGWLEKDGTIAPDRIVLVTGDQWAAMEQAMAARHEAPVNG